MGGWMNEWNVLLIILFSSSRNISLLIFWVLIVITLIRKKSNWKWCCWKFLINVYFIRGLLCLCVLPSRALVMNHFELCGLLSVTPVPCHFLSSPQCIFEWRWSRFQVLAGPVKGWLYLIWSWNRDEKGVWLSFIVLVSQRGELQVNFTFSRCF